MRGAQELLRPFLSSEMIAYPVGPQVNSLQSQGPDLIRKQGRIPLRFLMGVLEYIEETNPPEVRELLMAAHHFLRENLPPFATCALKWRIPFYSLRRNFCYLNRHRDHITLGFPHGYKLAPQPAVLLGESEKLKQVRYLKIRSVEDLYSEETLQILHEAMILDEMMAKVKPTFRRKNRRSF